jgi:NAD+ diphosphatase
MLSYVLQWCRRSSFVSSHALGALLTSIIPEGRAPNRSRLPSKADAAYPRLSELLLGRQIDQGMSWGFWTRPRKVWAPAGAAQTLLIVAGKVPIGDAGILYAVGRAASIGPPAGAAVVGVADGIDAMDADNLPAGRLTELIGSTVDWQPPRSLLNLVAKRILAEAEVTAVCDAVALLGWHRANAFSGADGTPSTPGDLPGRRRVLSSGRSVYPRIDPVAIVLCVSADGQRCLLGRGAKFPPGMYTCIAGFVEHAEQVEAAAAREVAEETGVRCGDIRLLASQPWPCGRGGSCELMLACAARAVPGGEAIDVFSGPEGGKAELEDARWFTRDEVRQMLARESGDAGLWVPPSFAIANRMIARWAERGLEWPDRLALDAPIEQATSAL